MTVKMDPDIAVLMPVFNPDDQLQESLQSLRAQTVPFCLYLIDDGSKNFTDYETLTEGIDTVIIRLPANLGITGAMNAGLREIMLRQFRYIARLDCGDVCHADRFAKQKAYLEAHTEIAVLGSACEFRERDDSHELLDRRVLVFPLSPDESRRKLFFNSPVCHPAVMIRRDVFEKIGVYSEAYPAAEDYDLMWRTSSAGFNITSLNDVLLIKEETPGSISQTRRRRQVCSRLFIQWANLKTSSLSAWLGLTKTILILAAPNSVVMMLKKALPRY